MIRTCIAAAFAFSLVTSAMAGEDAPRGLAARTELHAIHTLTLSDKQFLNGDAEAKATEISGQLRLPPAPGRLPVVVLMHGSTSFSTSIAALTCWRSTRASIRNASC